MARVGDAEEDEVGTFRHSVYIAPEKKTDRTAARSSSALVIPFLQTTYWTGRAYKEM